MKRMTQTRGDFELEQRAELEAALDRLTYSELAMKLFNYATDGGLREAALVIRKLLLCVDGDAIISILTDVNKVDVLEGK